MSKRILYLIGVTMAMIDFSALHFLDLVSYSQNRIPEEKKNYSFYKTKTYHQNPDMNPKISYHNKTIPKNRYSHISQEGLKIRERNKRNNLTRKFNENLKERNLEKALRK